MSDFIIKHDEPYEFGKDPNKRTFDELLERGFIVVDKDSGPTSHDTTALTKKILNIKRAGHSGTLDPKVTGILLMGLNRGTRLMEYMLKSNKEYVCLMYIHKDVDKKKIKEALEEFTGDIVQTPPVISAVKRVPRKRTIYEIKLLEVNGKNVLFRVKCQHGTYIRKLCSDIGEHLGCGAHMKELRRTKAGPFTENDNSISLDKLRNLFELYNEDKSEILERELRKYIRPMEDTLVDFKKVYIRDTAIESLSHGHNLAIPGILKLEKDIEAGEEIAVLTGNGELMAMGTALMSSSEVEKKNKGYFVDIQKVFIDI